MAHRHAPQQPHGHEVAVADNYLRRRLCREENIEVNYSDEVPDLDERAALWQSVSGHRKSLSILET